MSHSKLIPALGTIAVAALVTVGSFVLPVRPLPAQQNNEDESKIQTGFAISPVPLNLKGRNRALVGLGSYIVNAQSACNDCHTSPPFAAGGDPYAGQPEVINAAGYLAGGTPFGPGVVSRNITPHENGMPAGLTFAQFRDVLQHGTDYDHIHPVLFVMPWPVYGKMTERDMRAVYEYLLSIPPIDNQNP
jgi:hypothetical protein